LTTSLPICIIFNSSFCLITLARNSKTMLNRSGESGYPRLVPGWWGCSSGIAPAYSVTIYFSLNWHCWYHNSWRENAFCSFFAVNLHITNAVLLKNIMLDILWLLLSMNQYNTLHTLSETFL
jgi:hypothetical protein